MEPELTLSDHARVRKCKQRATASEESGVKHALPETLSHLQLCTAWDNFAQLPTELRTTALQMTFSFTSTTNHAN